jgi:hypothetical protein
MSTRTMVIMFLVFILAQAISMIVDWNTTMSATAYATISGATNIGSAINPFGWGNTIDAIVKITTWNYSFLQGGWAWLRFIGSAFTFAMIWPVLQLLIYGIGNIIGKIGGKL